MQRDDHPLVQWKPPVKVIIFPLVKRRGKIRHTAQLLMSKQGEEADLYWKQVVAGIRRHLARVGSSEDERDAELWAFFHAVQGELTRMACQHRQPDGAA